MNRVTSFILIAWCLGFGGALAHGQTPVLRVLAMPTLSEADPREGRFGRQVDDALFAEWRALVRQAEAAGATILVVEITTPGGDLAIAQQITHELGNLRARGVRTIAYVPEAATSAGALIALGCHELFLAPGAEIGNAIPRKRDAFGQFHDLEPKELTEVLAFAQKLALGSPFHPLLVRAMVDAECEVVVVTNGQAPSELMLVSDFERTFASRPESVRTVQIKSKREALKLVAGGNTIGLPGFPFESVMSRDQLPAALGLGDRPLHREELLQFSIPKDGSLSFRWFDPRLLLLVLAFVFLVLEIKTPGVGLFSILAILSLFGYFLVGMEDSASLGLCMGLLVVGVALLATELFLLPGFGIFGISGLLCILLSIYGATIDLPGTTAVDRLIPDSGADWERVQSWFLRLLVTAIAGVLGALFLFPQLHRLPFLRQLALGRASSETSEQAASSAADLHSLPSIGAFGVAETTLRPSGKARFGNLHADVVSDGTWIESGLPVRVVRREGNKIVVSGVPS